MVFWLASCHDNQVFLCNVYNIQWRTQKVSEGAPKFCHNRVTSQINLGSAEGTTIIGWSGGVPRKTFAKLHLKIRILKSEASRKPKKRSHNGRYSKLRGPRQEFPKIDVLLKKRVLISSFTFFSQHHVDL